MMICNNRIYVLSPYDRVKSNIVWRVIISEGYAKRTQMKFSRCCLIIGDQSSSRRVLLNNHGLYTSLEAGSARSVKRGQT